MGWLERAGTATTVMLKTAYLLLFFLAGTASALDPHQSITQLIHRSWTGRDGAPENVWALAQTADGYLWIGATNGLYRFDGIRFVRVDPPLREGPRILRVLSLLAARDGGLWITSTSGVYHLRNGGITGYSEQDGVADAYSLAEGNAGSIVAGTGKGLRIFRKGHWSDVNKEWNFPGKTAKQVYFDKSRNLWVATDDRVVYLPPGAKSFVDPAEPLSSVRSLYQFAQAPNRAVWLAETSFSAHTLRLTPSGQRRVSEVQVGADSVLFDKDGSLWVGSLGDGLRRVAFPNRIDGIRVGQFAPGAEAYTSKEGLSSDVVLAMLQDREGNIWCGTQHGIDQFRDASFQTLSSPAAPWIRGIADAMLLGGADGSLWVFSVSHGALRIAPDGSQSLAYHSPSAAQGFLRPKGFLAAAVAADGRIVTATRGARKNSTYFLRSEGPKLVRLDVPVAEEIPDPFALTLDKSGALWVLDRQKGLFQLSGGRTTPVLTNSDSGEHPGILYRDSKDRLWMGQYGRVLLWVDGTTHLYGVADGVPAAAITAFHEDPDRNIWISSGLGLSKFDGRRFQALPAGGELPFQSISGIEQDLDGLWWLASDRGVVVISPRELDRALADPAHYLSYSLYNILDGIPGEPREDLRRPVVTRTTDGRIWFATTHGIAYADPRKLPRNPLPPPVVVEGVKVNGKDVPATLGSTLPANTNEIEIDYTALSLSIPERVRFKYRLEGEEPEWHEAGIRRQAYYGRLSPKRHRFHVIACNNDGVWNPTGAVLEFSVAPALYQRLWVQVLCALLVIAVATATYRFRVRRISAALNSRFNERLEERTRIAREFHDTLLQTIQGSKMVADDALGDGVDAVHVRRTLERVSEWLGQAIQEGRSALNSLRSSAQETNNLAEALQRAGDECRFQRKIEFDLSVEGSGVDMHPIVRDEVYRIASEAIRNACSHSGATRLTVELSYLDGLVLRVRDDGKGFNSEAGTETTAGHFGLVGMYERAARINGKLTVSSSPGGGTQVELSVPRSVVFPRKQPASPLDKIKLFWKLG